MAAGISKAKGRRNSKSKRKPGFQAFPAKAGKRKVYGSGKRKVKTFPDGMGFVMTHNVHIPSAKVCNDRWSSGEPVMVHRCR